MPSCTSSAAMKIFSLARTGGAALTGTTKASRAAVSLSQLRHASGGDFIEVNPLPADHNNPSWKETHEIFAKTVFLTEIGTGLGVTLGAMFKEAATINYPFEKGPQSPRFRGE